MKTNDSVPVVPKDPHGTFISYAQNFEDLTLWRSLKMSGAGYYVDVGANHPSHLSVTQSLYQRGWRGINVEPIRRLHQLLCESRPEDTNLCVAVASERGQMTFHEAAVSGWSTLDATLAKDFEKSGSTVTQYQVEVQTLNDICIDHLKSDKPFQFLKIDVEGFEENVLRGFDLRRWKPWIIIIESPLFSDPAWLPIVMDAGYLYSHSDGVNRYFVHPEHAHLKNPLRMPPNVLDDFRLCEDHPLSAPRPTLRAYLKTWLKQKLRTTPPEL